MSLYTRRTQKISNLPRGRRLGASLLSLLEGKRRKEAYAKFDRHHQRESSNTLVKGAFTRLYNPEEKAGKFGKGEPLKKAFNRGRGKKKIFGLPRKTNRKLNLEGQTFVIRHTKERGP